VYALITGGVWLELRCARLLASLRCSGRCSSSLLLLFLRDHMIVHQRGRRYCAAMLLRINFRALCVCYSCTCWQSGPRELLCRASAYHRSVLPSSCFLVASSVGTCQYSVFPPHDKRRILMFLASTNIAASLLRNNNLHHCLFGIRQLFSAALKGRSALLPS